MKTDQEQFDEARLLRGRGDIAGARQILETLIARQPRSAALLATLGDIYWDLGLLDNAISSFRSATLFSPQSETASLALFHALWDHGLDESAFDEMRRFMMTNKSSEYEALLKTFLE